MSIHNTAVMGVRPTPQLLASTGDAEAVSRWVFANTAALVEYWDGQIDTVRLVPKLVRLPAAN